MKPSVDEGATICKEWEAEAKALEDTSSLRHDHIVSVKAIFSKGQRNYFMFQWADGGDLRDLCQKDVWQELTAELVKDVIVQLVGLAHALLVLHNYRGADGTESYRHGDLKPENILSFSGNTRFGTWKIADMGTAKHHFVATGLRGPTSTVLATPTYEPPEAFTSPMAARSRLYDIWSMGCITLELIVWLLYGRETLRNFGLSLSGQAGSFGPARYWIYDRETRTATVNPAVLACIAHIKRDAECEKPTALGDLVRIVETKLLVISLPQNNSSHSEPLHKAGKAGPTSSDLTEHVAESEPFRATAKAFHQSLASILEKGIADSTYLFTGTGRDGLPAPSFNEVDLDHARLLDPGRLHGSIQGSSRSNVSAKPRKGTNDLSKAYNPSYSTNHSFRKVSQRQVLP